jgi:hypothetical protein
MNLKWIYIDDVTKRFSGTTLRTWLVFLAFFVMSIAYVVACILMVFGLIKNIDLPDWVLTFYITLGLFCTGNGVLYLGKRINEQRGGTVCTAESTNEMK